VNARAPLGAGELRDLAARHGIRPSKTLGQNFLLDPNLARAIAAETSVGPGDRVLEIGAGLGSLTLALAETGASVVALEFDRSLLPALAEVTRGSDLEIRHADATRLDWDEVVGEAPTVLAANLPYNVGTTIVIDALERAPSVQRLVVMLQAEVGQRLAARAGESGYGAVSVRVAYHADARLVRRVPPDVFWPRPKVGSVVVRLDRLPSPAVTVDPPRLWRVVGEAFGQRRKTMRNAIRRMGLEPPAADALLERAGVDPMARPEQLDLPAFARIAEELAP
jgi:16S rRNA (adenine1518-N6/adenine1519-N6)-dimethyltransferase